MKIVTPEWLQRVADDAARAAGDEPTTVSAGRPPGWSFSPNEVAKPSILTGFVLKAVGREAIRAGIPHDWRPVDLAIGDVEFHGTLAV